MKKAVLLSALLSTAVAVGQGQIGQTPSIQIVGGDTAGTREFPFVAKIIYSGSQVGCTGSLIAPDKVLTAGHCVASYRVRKLSVGFGSTRALEPRYRVANKILHPEYSAQENDIAILRLETAVTTTQPVRILTLEEELRYAPSGGLGVAVGWGYTHPSGSGGELPQTLQKVTDVPIYTQEDCRRVLADLRERGKKPQPPSIHERVLCAGEEGRAVGQGDSGGPLLVRTPDGWAQVGVLSQATRDPSPQTVTYMGQYTRTAYFRDWIFPTYFLHFAHSARGGGWRTDLVLLNPERDAAEATVDLFGQDGTLREMGREFSLGELGTMEWQLPGGMGVQSGGAVVSSKANLAGFLRFRHEGGAALSVQAAPVASAFMVPVSEQVDRVGVAVFNAGDEEVTAVFRLGTRVFYETLPAQGKMAKFVDELFPSAPTGTLLVSADGGEITVLALELVGTSLITLPATPLN